MWVTNYMENYNKVKKSAKKFNCISRYSTTNRNTPTRTAFSGRPRTASSSREQQRPKTPIVHDLSRPKSSCSTREKTEPVISFEEFNKQFNNLKVKFDSHGYVIPQKYFPPEYDLAIQGKHVSLSERENKVHYMEPILSAVDNLPQPTQKTEEEEKEKEEEEKEQEPTKDEVPTVATPVPEVAEKTKDYHWICWPEPQQKEEVPQRPHTSLGIYRPPTPYGGGPGDDIEDRPSSAIPGYVFGDSEDITRGPPMTYVPELKSWVNASNEYDKDIVQNIMSSMYPSIAPPLPPEALRPQRQMTFTYGGRRSKNSNYNSMPDPLTHYSQSWRPLYEDRRTPSRQEMRHSVPQFPQIPGLERSKTDLRPMQRRVIRYPRSDDYVHERSMFMTTQPPCTGHFIIHPDWVSERMGKRKLSAARKKNMTSKTGLRYGTPQEV